MKRCNIRFIGMLLAIMLVFSMVVGCGGDPKKDTTQKDLEESKPDKTTEEGLETLEPVLPIVKDKIKLTFFTTFPAGHAAYFKTLNDNPVWKVLEDVTNIELDITAVPAVNFDERKNLLFASRDLTDIIYTSNGQNDALLYGINDDLIIPLDDLMEKYAYYLKQWTTYEPKIKGQNASVDGKTYYMPSIDITLSNFTGVGYYIRQEWLDKLDIEPPTTLDELYDTLKAFKDNDFAGGGNTKPFACANPDYIVDSILYSFGLPRTVYQIDDVVKYAPVQPEFKDALKYLNKLYNEGLIPSDYLTYDSNVYNAELLNNIGLVWAWSNGNLRNPLQAAGLSVEESWNVFRPINGMKGVGDKYFLFGMTGRLLNSGGCFISCTNKYPVETIKWLDYLNSQEGTWTIMYGPKGVTWDYDENGAPDVTEYVLNNPDGLSPDEVMFKNGAMEWGYISGASGPFHRAKSTPYWPFHYEDFDYNSNRHGRGFESLYSKYWKDWMDFDDSRQLPLTIKYTGEEKERIDVLSQDLTTLVDENIHKIIMGIDPIEKWDDIVAQLKKMNLDEYLSLYQTALDRVPKDAR